MNLPLKPKTYPISTSSIKPYKWLIKNPVDPYFGGSFFSLFCRLFLPGGGLSRSHVLIHGCLVRNQASGLENQRGLDTYESIFWGGLKEMKKKKKVAGGCKGRRSVFCLLRERCDIFSGLVTGRWGGFGCCYIEILRYLGEEKPELRGERQNCERKEQSRELQEEQKHSWKLTHSWLERSIPGMIIREFLISHFHLD